MHSDIQTANLIQALATAGIEPILSEGTTHLMVPPGYSLQNIDDAIQKIQPAKRRKSGSIKVLDLDSLIAYAADQSAQDYGYIMCSPDSCRITAVFNHNRALAGWGDHRAVFTAEKTPEFTRWLAQDGKPLAQTEFAEFIEDNLADIPGDDGPLLLNMATTIAASTAINFSSAKRLDNGQVQLVYNEVIDAKAGADGALKIPQKFGIGVRIFKNGEGYKLTARLKYRLHSGNVKFWYELERPERAIEDAFNGYVAALREKTTYSVLLAEAS